MARAERETCGDAPATNSQTQHVHEEALELHLIDGSEVRVCGVVGNERLALAVVAFHGCAVAVGNETPISPPSGPSQWLFQKAPAKSKFLAARCLRRK